MKYREAGARAPTYAAGRAFMSVRSKMLGYDVAVKGNENAPLEGPALFGPSHRHKEDPWLLGLAVERPIFCMAKQELWTSEYAYLGYLLSLVGSFPVNRTNPGHSTIRTARDHLRKDRAVGIFAEGSRYDNEEEKIVRGPDIGPLHRSIGRLAVLEQTPIVPIGIGLDNRVGIRLKSKVARIVIERALYPNPNLPKSEAEEKIMADFQASLQTAFTEASDAAAAESY